MFDPSMLLRLSTGEVEDPSLFPYPLSFHIVFVCIAAIFFIYRFITDGKPYQLILTLAIPFSLVLHVFPENRTWFYVVGLIELIMLICALGAALLWKSSEKDEEKEAKAAESTEAESKE